VNLEPAFEMIRNFEGFRSKPYLCPAGVPTIGYGSIWRIDGSRVSLSDAPITKSDAEILMQQEVYKSCVPAVLRLCPASAANPGVFNALVDFVFNLGAGRLQTSTLRRKINSNDLEGAKEQFRRWVRGGGRVLPGLVLRREAEVRLLQCQPNH
jgi:lysozyme